MWPPRNKYYNHSAMDSPLLLARPWTPPETEAEPSPRSDYFSDSFTGGDSAYSSYTEHHRWPPNQRANTTGARCDTPTDDHHRSRPKPIATHTEPGPYTPTRSFNPDNAHGGGAPQYPYTPDSSRILRRNKTELASSPTPWDDDYSEHSSSPVQNALSSCIAHFENLIQTRQPDEDQMEYIVGQFEAMASYLSAPESQTRRTDEHLFTGEGQEDDGGAAGLGISSSTAEKTSGEQEEEEQAQQAFRMNEAYVAEVGRYISSVKSYIEDLKMRLDEVKTLNSIQLEVIQDLRRQMKTVRQGMRSSLSMREEYEKAEQELADDIQIDNYTHNNEKEQGENTHDNNAHGEFGHEIWETIHDDDDDDTAATEHKHSIAETSEPTRSKTVDSHTRYDERTPRRRPPPGYKLMTIIHAPPQKRSFWSSIAEALDSFGGDLLLEY